MHRTQIEYGDYSWPIFTGSCQPPSVCPLAGGQCWARAMHRRFGSEKSTPLGKKYPWESSYNTDFSLKFNEDLLDEPLQVRKPSTILVAFTGDMFGPGSENYWRAQERVLSRVWQLPQHIFLFLTKSPENLARRNPWPPNALVGCSITGAESFERQQAMIAQLARVEGGRRWISYEPMLGPFLGAAFLGNVDWLVIGAQSGPWAVRPERAWVNDIIGAAYTARVPLFIKKNLLQIDPDMAKGERCENSNTVSDIL